VHSVALGPEHVLQEASHGWQILEPSAYDPVLHDETHTAPVLYGFAEEQVTQSAESPPEQVPQSA